MYRHAIDFSCTDAHGRTCLHLCAQQTRFGSLCLDPLTAFFATAENINLRDNDGCTALDYSLQNECHELAERLVALGAEPPRAPVSAPPCAAKLFARMSFHEPMYSFEDDFFLFEA